MRFEALTGRSPTQRRCLAGSGVQETAGMVRFVIGPDKCVVPDVDERLPGRGFWLRADRDLINKACGKNMFARVARMPVCIPANLTERVEALLVRRCQRLIGLARRAGQVVFGYEKTHGWLAGGRAAVILEASDAAPNARGKLGGTAYGLECIKVLRSDELGVAAGRDRIVHGAIAPGSLAERLCRDAKRLGGLRQDSQSEGSGTRDNKVGEALRHDGR